MKTKSPFNLQKIFKSGVDYWVGGYKYFTKTAITESTESGHTVFQSITCRISQVSTVITFIFRSDHQDSAKRMTQLFLGDRLASSCLIPIIHLVFH